MKYTLYNGDLCNKRDSSISNKNGITSSKNLKCSTIRLVPYMGIMVTAIMTTMALRSSNYTVCHVSDACGISNNKDSHELATIDTGVSLHTSIHTTTIDTTIIKNLADMSSKDLAAMAAKDSAARTLKGAAIIAIIDQQGFYPFLDPNNINKKPIKKTPPLSLWWTSLPQATNPAHAEPAPLSVQEDDAVRVTTTDTSSTTHVRFDWLNLFYLSGLVLVVFVASHACFAVPMATKICRHIYVTFISKFNSTHMYPNEQQVPRSTKVSRPPTWTVRCLLTGVLLGVAAGSPCNYTNGSIVNPTNCSCGTNACSVSNGLYCYGSGNRCAGGPPCSHTNGLTINGNECTCGTSDCDATSGLFCELTNNKCGKFSKCDNIDGIVVNQQNCSCGFITCDTTTGLFCTNKGASNYCATTKYCDQTEGLFVNSYDCNCDASGSTECDISTGRYCTILTKSCSKLPTSYAGVAEISVLGSTVVGAAMGAYKYAGIQQDNEPVYKLLSDTNTFFMYWTENSGNWTIATTLGGNITRPYVYWHGNIPSQLSPEIQASSLGFMDYKGGSGCTSDKPCTECQGDCDNDDECFGALKCLQRSSGDEISVNCGLDIPAQDNRDYCYDKSRSSGSKMEKIMVVSSLTPYCTTILNPETFCAGMNSKTLMADAYKTECEGLTCEISKDAPKCCDTRKEDALPTQCLLQSPNSCHGSLKTLILMEGSDNPFDGVDKNKAIHR